MPHLFDTEILGSKEQQTQVQLVQEQATPNGVVNLINNDFVIIPLEVQGVVPYGIGSVKIRLDGTMDMIAPSGHFFGREIEEKFRKGEITALRLEMVKTEEALETVRKVPDPTEREQDL